MRSEVLYGPAFATARLTLSAGETVRAEAGAMVAMSSGLAMQTSTQGGVMKGLRRAVLGCSWRSTFFSGEGFVRDLTGPGRIHLQTRSQDAFLGWLIPTLPKPGGGGGGGISFGD